MNCPKCGIEIVEGNKFCSNCGAPLPVAEVQKTQAAAPSAAQTVAQPNAQQATGQSTQSAKRVIEIPIEYKPISAWGYFGYNLLFAIPVVGWIFLIVYALGGTKNKNLKNFARSQFIWLLIAIIFIIVFAIVYALGAARF